MAPFLNHNLKNHNTELIRGISHNLALEIFKRCDFYKDGVIDKWEFNKWTSGNDIESVKLLTDLFENNKDYE